MAKNNKSTTKAEHDYALVKSKTGRGFNRGGMRFLHNAQTPVDFSTMSPDKVEAIKTCAHLDVKPCDERTFEMAMQNAASSEVHEDPELIVLRRRIEELTEENDTLRSEIALLTGRRSGGTGPRENDDKSSSSPAAMGG